MFFNYFLWVIARESNFNIKFNQQAPASLAPFNFSPLVKLLAAVTPSAVTRKLRYFLFIILFWKNMYYF